MPFKNNIFDMVFASSILEHLENYEINLVITKFKKILKNNGYIFMDIPNPSLLQEFLRKIMIKLKIYEVKVFKENPELGHHSFLKPRDWKKFGFKLHGCIGWVTRKKLPLGILWDLYDLIVWYIPYIAGTVIGIKKIKKT